MIKNSIVSRLLLETAMDKNAAKNMVDAIINAVSDVLASGESLKITGFGKFKVNYKQKRIGRNPKTKKPYDISPRHVVSFAPSTLLKKEIQDGFSARENHNRKNQNSNNATL